MAVPSQLFALNLLKKGGGEKGYFFRVLSNQAKKGGSK